MTSQDTLTYQIAAPFVLLRVAGAPPTAEVRRVLLALSHEPDLPARALLLVDARDAAGVPTPASVRARFKYFRVLAGRALPLAAIVTSATVASLLTGLLYKLEAQHRAAMRIETFGDGEAAKRWLRDRASERRKGRPAPEPGPPEWREC
jgi:hypothetical protein